LGLLGGVCTLIFIAVVVDQVFAPEAVAKRKLRKTPATPLGKITSSGLHKVVGRVRYGDTPLVAPLSGRTCACYVASIEEYSPGPRTTPAGVEIVSESKHTEFFVDDDSGTARVVLEGAVISLVSDAGTSTKEDANQVDKAIVAFLKRSGRTQIPPIANLIYREGIIEEGERIAVFGHAVREAVTTAKAMDGTGYRDSPTELVLRGGEKVPLIASDFPAVLT
jgi:hypothetical protein